MASNVTLTIHHATTNVLAFSLDHSLYFLRLLPIPQVFDANLTPQLIPNLDSWFQAKTQQRYSYQNITDMMAAYLVGLSRTYSLVELTQLINQATIAARHHILVDLLGAYGKLYWIELLNPAKLDVYVEGIRENFLALQKALSSEVLYNNLCRLLYFATKNQPGTVEIIKRLIERLRRVPEAPHYPPTPELDVELQKLVLQEVLQKPQAYRNVPDDLQLKLRYLSGQP